MNALLYCADEWMRYSSTSYKGKGLISKNWIRFNGVRMYRVNYDTGHDIGHMHQNIASIIWNVDKLWKRHTADGKLLLHIRIWSAIYSI